MFLTLGLLNPQHEANGAKVLNNVKQIRKVKPELAPVLGAIFKDLGAKEKPN